MQSLHWLCTKASRNLFWSLRRNLFRNPVGSATFSGAFSWTLLKVTWLCIKKPPRLHLPLHQSLPSPEPSPEPCWTWLCLHQGFLEASPEPFAEPCWTCPGSAPKPLATFSGAFAGTFSGTLLNRNPPPPHPWFNVYVIVFVCHLVCKCQGTLTSHPTPSHPPTPTSGSTCMCARCLYAILETVWLLKRSIFCLLTRTFLVADSDVLGC